MSKNRITELEKCQKELKRRECDYGISDKTRRSFEIELQKHYVKIGKIFKTAHKATRCQIDTKFKIDKNGVVISLPSPTQLVFKTPIFNKRKDNQKDYSVTVCIDQSCVLVGSVTYCQPPKIILDWYKDKVETGDYPYEDALYAFEKHFPKFEKSFYKFIDTETKKLKKKLKKESSNDKKRNHKKAFGCT